MKHIKTSAGFEAELDEGCFDDMELFDALMAMQAGDGTQLPKVVDKIMGDAKPALYDSLRDEKGRVPAKGVSEAIAEIIQQLSPKNA